MLKMPLFQLAVAALFVAVAVPCSHAAEPALKNDWSEQQIAKLPASEKPVHLFNGKDFTG